jgi:prepilin-type N-terminal cleavage/methylation domain-containing protein
MNTQACLISLRNNPQKGFTLVEVMVASVILGLTVSAVAIMIINSSVIRATNDHFRQARNLAHQQLEDQAFHMFNFPNIVDQTANTPFRLDFNEPALQFVPANRQISVATRNFAGFAVAPLNVQYRRVRCTVTWTENTLAQSLVLRKRVVKVR